MTVFQIIALLLTAAALAGYVNHRFLKLPTTIALMGFALLASLTGLLLHQIGLFNIAEVSQIVARIDFADVMLNNMLGLLLFAGALHIDLGELRSVRGAVIVLATFGVVISAAVTGGLIWLVASTLGLHLPLLYALLFGALIAPTDPIAVLALLKNSGISKRLYTKIGGESLFNDGIGVMAFLTILGLVLRPDDFQPTMLATDICWKMLGGIAAGTGVGWLTFQLLRSINEYKVEVLLTLALATGGYVLAELIHVSGPIAMAAAGLLIGNHGRQQGMTPITRKHLDLFWELLDEVLNAILFILIGLELMVITITTPYFLMGLLAIPILLLARFVSVAAPISLMRMFRDIEKGTIRILTWGGLRGGISIAMALSLPKGDNKDLILAMTYIVVVFSILVQGLTFPRLLRALKKQA